MLPIGDTWWEILRYIETHKALGEFNFSEQPVEDVVQQMALLDEDSRDALCLTRKAVSEICRDTTLMRWVRHQRFEKLFASRLATINALKPVLYGAAYPQARFERAMVVGWDIMMSRIDWGLGQWKPIDVLQYIRERPGLGQAFSWHLHWNSEDFMWPYFIKKLLANEAENWPPRENLLLILNFDETVASGELLFDFLLRLDASLLTLMQQTPAIVVKAFNQRPNSPFWLKFLNKSPPHENWFATQPFVNIESVVLVARRLQLDAAGNRLPEEIATTVAVKCRQTGAFYRLSHDDRVWVANLYYPDRDQRLEVRDFSELIFVIGSVDVMETMDRVMRIDKSVLYPEPRAQYWFSAVANLNRFGLTSAVNKGLEYPDAFLWVVYRAWYEKINIMPYARDLNRLIDTIDVERLDGLASRVRYEKINAALKEELGRIAEKSLKVKRK